MRKVEVEERIAREIGETVERVKKLWLNGRIAKIALSWGRYFDIEVEDLGDSEAEEEESGRALPALSYENRWVDDCTREVERMTLKLPPPWFDYPIEEAAKLLERFLRDFAVSEESVEFGFGDGIAILNSFAKLCSKLYEEYSTRGIEATVEDLGGDYPLIKVRAVWHG
jgi:hypothetical protein